MQLSGTTSIPGRCGAATFTDLQIDTVGSYVLRVTASLAGSVSSFAALAPLVVIHGEPSRLYLSTPPAGFKAGRPFKVQPTVSVLDVGGNAVAAGSPGVWARCLPSACVLTQNYRPLAAVFQPAAGGAAGFAALGVQARIYPAKLRFYAQGLAAVDSDPFSVMDAPYRIAILAQPPPTAQAGVPFCVAAQIQAKNEAPFAYFDAQPALVNATLFHQRYQSSFLVPGWAAGAAVDVRTGVAELCGLVLGQLLDNCYLQLESRVLLDGTLITFPQARSRRRPRCPPDPKRRRS